MPPIRSTRAAFQRLEARLHLDAGVIDTSFGDDGVAAVPVAVGGAELTDVALTPDGRIVVTGTTSADGTLSVTRFHANGTLDPTFGNGGRATSRIGGDAEVLAAAVQPDHKIVVVGRREQQYFVLRYNTNGKHDRTFGDGGIVRRTFGQNVSEARDVAILDDGSILVAGNARQANGSTAAGVARFEPDGSIDERFGDDGTVVTKFDRLLGDTPSVFVNRVAVRDNLAANDVVLAGRFTTGDFFPDPDDDALAVMRLDSDGSIDQTFSGDGLALADFGGTQEEATGVAIDAQGRPIVAVGGVGVLGALRLRSSGSRDTSFGRNGLARMPDDGLGGDTHDLLIDDARIVLAGKLGVRVPGTAHLARLLEDGGVDTEFGTNGLSANVHFNSGSPVARVVTSPDGTYVVGGTGVPGAPSRQLQLSKVFSKGAPSARVVAAPNLGVPRAGSFVFHVQWRASNGIDTATIGSNDVRVTGLNGYARTAVLASAPLVRAATDVIVRYKVAPPNGTEWTGADNGTYTITALAGAVQGLDGVPSAAAVLGTFRVAIA